jgi:hypothetical protein
MNEEWKKLPKTRAEAMNSTNKLYFTGKPCIRGHIAPRRAPGSQCSICKRERDKGTVNKYHQTEEWKEYQKNYQKEYRTNPANRERLRAIQKKYYIKKRYGGDVEAYERAQAKKGKR